MAIATIGALFVASVPGTGALYFSSSALRATDTQIQVAEQGQITDRWNAAVTNLGSANIEIRLGGIYALQRIMQDSPRDQSTVVAVLCAFVRDHTSSGAAPPGASASHLATDIQAALNVVGTRNIAHDDGAIVDLNDAQLHKAQLSSMVFYDADFSGADLSSAYLASTKFLGANLSGANFSGTDLTEADLSSADLSGTDLSGAQISGANLFDADLTGANLTGVITNSDQAVATNFNHADLTCAAWANNVPPPKGWVLDPRSNRLYAPSMGPGPIPCSN